VSRWKLGGVQNYAFVPSNLGKKIEKAELVAWEQNTSNVSRFDVCRLKKQLAASPNEPYLFKELKKHLILSI
jgi:hypothetical protein